MIQAVHHTTAALPHERGTERAFDALLGVAAEGFHECIRIARRDGRWESGELFLDALIDLGAETQRFRNAGDPAGAIRALVQGMWDTDSAVRGRLRAELERERHDISEVHAAQRSLTGELSLLGVSSGEFDRLAGSTASEEAAGGTERDLLQRLRRRAEVKTESVRQASSSLRDLVEQIEDWSRKIDLSTALDRLDDLNLRAAEISGRLCTVAELLISWDEGFSRWADQLKQYPYILADVFQRRARTAA